MKQVFLSGKGEIAVFDVPVPGHLPNAVLVRNAFSLISTGTEGTAISRRGSWFGVFEKAMKSHNRVQQVWQLARSQGISKTWDMVRRKLEDYVALGYSCAGMVVEVGCEDLSVRAGDLVACMGGGVATHSEYVVVPANLMAPIPKGVACSEAAFGALACIALQGIRRLEMRAGEWIGVLGLGLIGQIAVQLLVRMGYRAIGIDLLSQRAAKAQELAGIDAWSSEDVDSIYRVNELTNGYGLDGVIVCAATQSNHPINLAFDLCRKRGRVSLIGDVGLNLVRAKMYQKEIELRMSCSYGPGRYDDDYEFKGLDYPYPYVRWTEKRNLEYVLDLLERGELKLASLISHRCPVEKAAEGYARIKKGDPETYGVLLDYGALPETQISVSQEMFTVRHPARASSRRCAAPAGDVIRIGIIGTGSFAKNVHIPNLTRLSSSFRIVGLASRTGRTAEVIARKESIPLATSDYRVLLDDSEVDAILITTRHAIHGRLVMEALEAGKHVFVEKPMCITVGEGEQIVAKADEVGLIVRVGFNRRFSPYINTLRQAVGTKGSRMLLCRVNIGPLQNDWSNTPEEGGRLLGEGVHFFDLCNWFMGQEPISVSAVVAGDIVQTNPNVMVQIQYADSCTAQILYTALGHPGAGKEYFEAFGNGRTVICDDYRIVRVFGSSIKISKKHRGDKGHLAELEEFAAAIRGNSYPVEGADARAGLLATWMAHAVLYTDLNPRATMNPEC